jgi:hypothetical protein
LKICGVIHKSRCTTGINDTSFDSVVDTSGKFATSNNLHFVKITEPYCTSRT